MRGNDLEKQTEQVMNVRQQFHVTQGNMHESYSRKAMRSKLWQSAQGKVRATDANVPQVMLKSEKMGRQMDR